MNIKAANAAVVAYVIVEQRTAIDVDANGDATSLEIPESHTTEDPVDPDLTVTAAVLSDEPHSVEVRSEVPVEVDSDVSSGKSMTVNKFDRTSYDALNVIAKLE